MLVYIEITEGHQLTLKAPNKIAADNTLFFCSRQHFIFCIYLSTEIRLDVSWESSAWQRIHMKYQVLFSLKNNEQVFINVVCCNPLWRLRIKIIPVTYKEVYSVEPFLPQTLVSQSYFFCQKIWFDTFCFS